MSVAKVFPPRVPILGVAVHAINWEDTLQTIYSWAKNRETRYVCLTNAHSSVTGSRDAAFGRVLAAADLALPDGAPIAWTLRRLGFRGQERINGPDLMWRYCELIACTGQSLYLLGGTEETLTKLRDRLINAFPELRIAGVWSPPFRALTPEEDAEAVARINESGAGVVFVSLGCPKQELWMAAHRGRVQAVMIGVGAAFSFHAGTIRRAPLWVQRAGLEWIFRLMAEPRRLWKRYLFTNTLFVLGTCKQLLLGRR